MRAGDKHVHCIFLPSVAAGGEIDVYGGVQPGALVTTQSNGPERAQAGFVRPPSHVPRPARSRNPDPRTISINMHVRMYSHGSRGLSGEAGVMCTSAVCSLRCAT